VEQPKTQSRVYRAVNARGLTLAVYAPFGSDPVLSTFPDGKSSDLASHPIILNLQKVARTGVRVVAMVDLFDRDTYLVEIAPGRPGEINISSRGKQQMDSAQTLTDLLTTAHRLDPEAQMVVTIEGHGAGFMPDLDLRLMTLENETGDGKLQWRLGAVEEGQLVTQPLQNDGEPFLKAGAPVLPIVGPTSPTNHPALSNWAMAAAFRAAQEAGAPKFSVIHFNVCFDMSVELLHTVAPYAEFATGYCNYNFFSAGEAYPRVFDRLAAAGSASSEDLAKWFAYENHQVLLEAGHEPTVAGTVELARMHDIVEKVDDLSDALLAALRTASPTERPAIVDKIRQAIVGAQQYDSRPDYVLEAPDELTDLDSFATELLKYDFSPYKVAPAADALRNALSGIKQYGDVGTPWMATGDIWDFSSKNLAMNIFLPDPLLKGLWDWRSQYYLDVNPDPGKPQIQRNIIDFVKITDWVDFLIEYHKEAPFVGLLPATIPEVPLLRSNFNPRCRQHPVVGTPGGETSR
jgi:hypothetical protein